ncbi:MAG: metalloregulator ArsR/SmtB family transcription factor [Candidatus Limnocylindrales bacterium]
MVATRNPTSAPIRPGGLVRPGLTAAQLPSVEFDARTAYDFLTSGCANCGELEDLLSEDRLWVEKSRAALYAELGLGDFARTCSGFLCEFSRLLVSHPDVRTARETVELVDDLDQHELLESMLGELLEDAEFGAMTRRAIDGDEAAYKELQATLESYKGHPVLTLPIALLAPTGRAVLHAWLPLFEVVEARIGRMLDRDVAMRREEDSTHDPIGFVERVTNGIRLVPEQRIRRIALAPSYFGRPYNSLSKVGDVQAILYPISDAALGAADRLTPPASTVRLYRALGDETRLLILRFLAQKDHYLTEIANELQLSKPTVKHHLAQLRSAGLVTVTDEGNFTYYSLRHDRAEEAGVELRAYLAH